VKFEGGLGPGGPDLRGLDLAAADRVYHALSGLGVEGSFEKAALGQLEKWSGRRGRFEACAPLVGRLQFAGADDGEDQPQTQQGGDDIAGQPEQLCDRNGAESEKIDVENHHIRRGVQH
jgi:hypothetical protein